MVFEQALAPSAVLFSCLGIWSFHERVPHSVMPLDFTSQPEIHPVLSCHIAESLSVTKDESVLHGLHISTSLREILAPTFPVQREAPA